VFHALAQIVNDLGADRLVAVEGDPALGPLPASSQRFAFSPERRVLGQGLWWTRLVRLMRLLRTGIVLSRALQAERRLTTRSTFRFAAIATLFLVFSAGAAEATVDQGDFGTFWDGIWWAVVTVTTVGYGDLYPHTVAGRLIAMLLMLVGIGFIAVLTASIASIFVKSERADETAEIAQTLKTHRTGLG
jgi:voltage-gated potassium channel